MAIALVGQAGVTGSSIASPGPAVSYTSTAGNTLIVTGLVYAGATTITGITSISDSAGNTWHFSTSNSNNPASAAEGTSGNFLCCFTGWSISAAAVTSVSIHDGTGNSDFWRLAVSEWSGIGAADAGAAATGTAGNPSVTLSLSNAGDLMVGSADSAVANMTALPAGWTALSGAGAANNYVGYDLPGSSGSMSPTWTTSDVTKDWAEAVMAFTPVAPAPPAAASPFPSPQITRRPAVIVSNAGWRGAGHSR
jgi:hypothetical protein